MKRYSLFFLIFGFIGINLYSQTESSDLSFDKQEHDFGTIKEKNGKISCTFIFKNIGSKPVIINNIVSGCGCIGNEYTKEVVKPGEKGNVTLSYNPDHRPGKFSKKIIIFSNNADQINWLSIKGDVIPSEHPVEEDYPYAFGNGLYLHLNILSFPRIAVGSSGEIILRYANDSDNAMNLKFVVEGNNTNILFVNPDKLKAKGRGQMIVKYKMPKAIDGAISVNIYPIVNGKKLQQPLLLKVAGSK